MALSLQQLPPAFAGGVAVLAFLALALLAAFLLALKRGSRLSGELAALREEMTALKAAPRRHEYRLEQYDILWYPVLTIDEGRKTIIKAAAGFPHCRSCGERLKENGGGKEWGCPKCEFRCAASVIDVVVMDSVAAKAVQYYRQRHPGFTLASPPAK